MGRGSGCSLALKGNEHTWLSHWLGRTQGTACARVSLFDGRSKLPCDEVLAARHGSVVTAGVQGWTASAIRRSRGGD